MISLGPGGILGLGCRRAGSHEEGILRGETRILRRHAGESMGWVQRGWETAVTGRLVWRWGMGMGRVAGIPRGQGTAGSRVSAVHATYAAADAGLAWPRGKRRWRRWSLGARKTKNHSTESMIPKRKVHEKNLKQKCIMSHGIWIGDHTRQMLVTPNICEFLHFAYRSEWWQSIHCKLKSFWHMLSIIKQFSLFNWKRMTMPLLFHNPITATHRRNTTARTQTLQSRWPRQSDGTQKMDKSSSAPLV